MLAKIYSFTWLVFFAIFLLTFFSGNLSMVAWTVFGFVAFEIIFMGMIGVLPITASHPESKKETSPRTVKIKPETSLEVVHSPQSVGV
jgi:hypothetical protein